MRSGVNSFTRLVAHDSLPGLLSVLAFKYDELAPLCAQAFANEAEKINDLLASQFLNRGFVIEDRFGDVQQIPDMEIGSYEPKLLRVDHDKNEDTVRCAFEIITSVYFSADISYDDLSTATYDNDLKDYVVWNKISETVESSEIIMAHVILSFQRDDLSYVEIEETRLSGSDAVRVATSDAGNYK